MLQRKIDKIFTEPPNVFSIADHSLIVGVSKKSMLIICMLNVDVGSFICLHGSEKLLFVNDICLCLYTFVISYVYK